MSTSRQEPIGPGRFILVVGPSGAGKDTIVAGVKTACSENPAIVFPRRIVTRAATAAEDHDSLDALDFERARHRGAFAFCWQAHGLHYGIPSTADADIRAGRTVVCNVSRGVVADVRLRYARVEVVAITAPPEVLAARLSGRARASDGSLTERIKRNDAYAGFEADHTIDNRGAPEAAIRQLLAIIAG